MSPMDFIFHFMQTFNIVRIIFQYIFVFLFFAPWMGERVRECCLSQFYPLPVTTHLHISNDMINPHIPDSGVATRTRKNWNFSHWKKKEVNGKKPKWFGLKSPNFSCRTANWPNIKSNKKKNIQSTIKIIFQSECLWSIQCFFFFNQYLCAFQRMPNIIFYWKAFFSPSLLPIFISISERSIKYIHKMWCVVFSIVCLRGFCTHTCNESK